LQYDCFWMVPYAQFLPEKYSYFRRVDHAGAQLASGEEGSPIDCVICMAAVDISQRCNECVVCMLSPYCKQKFNHNKMILKVLVKCHLFGP
jgi:hypothetical protein